MIKLIQAQWHMVAAADDIVEKDGEIIGVVMDGQTHLFLNA